ncbi:MAG: stage II sporulation protein M [Candidatus Aenigmarchaeota archaeon]|nr:stage II sporulation protein M [Candidatus Aenigmarchaeota archaeon]
MVLESLLSPETAKKKPYYLVALSAVFSFLAIWLANMVFPAQASAFAVALMAMFFVPYFHKMLSLEEEVDRKESHQHIHGFLTRHKPLIVSYSAFFLGTIITFSFVFMFVQDYSNVFSLQLDWFKSNNFLAGAVVDPAHFQVYLMNNTQVMMIFFILSVIFGAGAIFILTWNASVIAVYLGIFAEKLVPSLGQPTAYLYGVSAGLASIALHGIPEIAGYFFAGVAGGILSTALIRETPGTPEFNEVVKDSLVWILAAEMLIVLGAALEALAIF